MIAHNACYFTHLFNDQLEVHHQHQGVRGDADRAQIQILQLLLIGRAGGGLLEKTASLVADVDFKILVETSASWRSGRGGCSKSPWAC